MITVNPVITLSLFVAPGFLQKELVRDLLKECDKMQSFDHPNVLKLLGVCLDGGPTPYIVTPFMVNGSLLSYLKQERENLVRSTPTDDVVSGFAGSSDHVYRLEGVPLWLSK